MINFEIRNTISTDLVRLAAIDHSVNTDYVWQVDLSRDAGQVSVSLREIRLPRTIRIDYPRPPEELADTFHLRPMLSVMNGMEAIAYVRFTDTMVPHAVWITDVVVGRPVRGQGIGKKLIAAAEEWGLKRNLRRSIIEVQSKNAPAIRMLQKMGFEFCGYNDQYYTSRDVALFFSRAIY